MCAYGIIIHGGAGDSDTDDPHAKGTMQKIIDSSCKMLRDGCSAVDVAEHAVSEMENSGKFNAGAGSCLTEKGTIEMDAGIMNGETMQCGAVAIINGVKNPVMVARQVMSESEHSLIAGNGALEFALAHGFSKFEIVPKKTQMEKLEKILMHKYGTVGAVVIDAKSNIVSAVSTGGIWSKTCGRIGDSAIAGSGFYANNSAGGAVATGEGDVIIKSCLTKNVCDMMYSGISVQEAADIAIHDLGRLGGKGGVIAVGRDGKIGASFNTKTMLFAHVSDDGAEEPPSF